MWIVSSLLLLAGFVFLFASGSEPMTALLATLWISPLALFASYFLARRSRNPTPTEARLAKGWVVFRRVFCYTTSAVAVFIGAGMILIGIKMPALSLVGSGAFFVVIAFVAARVGMYGSETEYTFTGDKVAHEKRKRRYGWE